MLKLENSIRGLSFSRVAFDLTIQGNKNYRMLIINKNIILYRVFDDEKEVRIYNIFSQRQDYLQLLQGL